MNPYLQAFKSYHRDGDPHIPWIDALDFHLQHGVVISHAAVFLMARRVDWFAPDAVHLSLDRHPHTYGAWHIWSAAGQLEGILKEAQDWGAALVSWQRRTNRLHRYRLKGSRILPFVQSARQL